MSHFPGTEDFGGSDYPDEGYIPDPQFKVKTEGTPAHRPTIADLSRTPGNAIHDMQQVVESLKDTSSTGPRASEKDNPLKLKTFSKIYPFTDESVDVTKTFEEFGVTRPMPRNSPLVDKPDGHTPSSNLTDKDTNPKDVIGSNKLPLSLVPETLTIYASLGFLEGALKYGRYNWRVAGVRSSIYIDALKRHIAAYESGEDMSEHGVPHLSNMLACIGIIIDAKVAGKLIDDRPPKAMLVPDLIRLLSEDVVRLKEKFKDHHPHQYTIEDSPRTEPPPCFNIEKFDKEGGL